MKPLNLHPRSPRSPRFLVEFSSLSKRATWVLGCALALSLSACPGTTPEADAGEQNDAGETAADTGQVADVVDAGQVRDAGAPRDAGLTVSDAGQDAVTSVESDAGSTVDAGEPEPITGDEAGEFDDPLDVTLPHQSEMDIQQSNEEDCFRFSTLVVGALRAETSDGSGGCPGDTKMKLYVGDSATASFEDDDDGEGLCSLLEEELPPNSYVICVSGWSSGTPSGIVLDIAIDEYICGDGSLDPAEECDQDEGCNAECLVVDGLLRETEVNDELSSPGVMELPLDEIVRGHVKGADDVDLWRISLPGGLRPGALSLWLGGLDPDSTECGDSNDLRMALFPAADLTTAVANSDAGPRCRAIEIARINNDVIFGDESFVLAVDTIARPGPYTLHATYIEGICGNGMREPSETCELNEADAHLCNPSTCQRIIPVNDICYRALPLEVTDDGILHPLSVTTEDASDVIGVSCQGATADGSDRDHDLFFTFTAPVAGRYVVEATADWNHVVAVAKGSCASLQELACSNSASAPVESVEVDLAQGEQVWVIADAYASADGIVSVAAGLLLPPINDECSNALDVTSSLPNDGSAFLLEGSIRAASDTYTYNGAESCTSNVEMTGDVFYSFTAPMTGTLEAWAKGNGFNAVVVVENDLCSAASSCATDGLQLFEVEAGQKYVLVVDSADSNTGSFSAALRYVIPPANDLCAAATEIVFVDDQPLVFAGDTSSASNSASLGCATGSLLSPDVFYHVVVDEDAFVTFDVEGDHDFVMGMVDACAGSEIQCTTANLGAAHISGTFSPGEFFVVIDGTDTLERGSFTFTVQKHTLVQPGESCADATPLTETAGSLSGDLSMFAEDLDAEELGSCTPYSSKGRDGTFALTVPAGATLDVEFHSVDGLADEVLYLVSGCSGSNVCLAGADENTSVAQGESLSWTNDGPELSVTIVLDEWINNNNNGVSKLALFQLDWSLQLASVDDAGVSMNDAGVGANDAGLSLNDAGAVNSGMVESGM
ncbi:MAG: hypothetical protein GY822_18285 [Deltaproteobacteria bacterium]|nr:hypothetical protein [Deltaproteobacteria bacterium]